jgi:hypothetical protein
MRTPSIPLHARIAVERFCLVVRRPLRRAQQVVFMGSAAEPCRIDRAGRRSMIDLAAPKRLLPCALLDDAPSI